MTLIKIASKINFCQFLFLLIFIHFLFIKNGKTIPLIKQLRAPLYPKKLIIFGNINEKTEAVTIGSKFII